MFTVTRPLLRRWIRSPVCWPVLRYSVFWVIWHMKPAPTTLAKWSKVSYAKRHSRTQNVCVWMSSAESLLNLGNSWNFFHSQTGGAGLAFISYPDAIARFEFIPQVTIYYYVQSKLFHPKSLSGCRVHLIQVERIKFTQIFAQRAQRIRSPRTKIMPILGLTASFQSRLFSIWIATAVNNRQTDDPGSHSHLAACRCRCSPYCSSSCCLCSASAAILQCAHAL